MTPQWGIERSVDGWSQKRTYYPIRYQEPFGSWISPETPENTRTDYVAKTSVYSYNEYFYAQQDIPRSFAWISLGLA